MVLVYNLSLAINLRVKYNKEFNLNPKNTTEFILEIWYKLGAIPWHGNLGPQVIDKNQPIGKARLIINTQLNPVVNISDLGKGPCRVKG